MTADALRLRRARRAIYGPPMLALVGVALIAAGVFGLATRDDAHDTNTALVPPATVHAAQSFVLVDARGRLYPGGGTDRTAAMDTIVPKNAAVVAATASPDGGHWLVTSDGRVVGVGTKPLGEHKIRRDRLRSSASPRHPRAATGSHAPTVTSMHSVLGNVVTSPVRITHAWSTSRRAPTGATGSRCPTGR